MLPLFDIWLILTNTLDMSTNEFIKAEKFSYDTSISYAQEAVVSKHVLKKENGTENWTCVISPILGVLVHYDKCSSRKILGFYTMNKPSQA